MSDTRYSNNWKGKLFLIGAAFIWGSCLVAQKSGTDYIGPATFVGIRSIIGFLSLFAVVSFLNSRKSSGEIAEEKKKYNRKTTIIGSTACGVFCCASLVVQQYGIAFTSVGKGGFITALYIIIIPMVGMIWGRFPGIKLWISVAVAVAGLYLMCITDGFGTINKGDVLMFAGALLLVCHFYCIDHFCTKVDPIKMSCYQFLVSSIICLPVAVFAETIELSAILDCAVPILYAGICSSAIGYTFQMIGQQTVEPTRACLLMSTESMFSLLSGMVILGEILTVREYIGCGLMFAAVILSQLPEKQKN